MNGIRHIQDLNVERSYLLRSVKHNPSRKLRADNPADVAEVDWDPPEVVDASYPRALAGGD